MLTEQEKKRFNDGPAEWIERDIREFVASSPANRMPSTAETIIFDEPLVRFAEGRDPLFDRYKSVIAPTHLTPREALAASLNKSADEVPERLSVISWVLPITEPTRRSNRAEEKVPSRLWSHTRWYGEKLNDALRRHVVEVLHELGYLATAPQLEPYFKTASNEKGPYSNWSERHAAYAAGQGSFSLSDGFITDRGIAHRCGSVITDLVLAASPRTAEDHYANCLYYFDGTCKVCVERCPADAISEAGHDKKKCQQYLRDLGYRGDMDYNDATSVAGCGLCQAKVPCEAGIPAKILKKRAG